MAMAAGTNKRIYKINRRFGCITRTTGQHK
jgi:hypothetical protein